MYYKQLFAALAVAFFLAVGAITAQTKTTCMSDKQILDYCGGKPEKIFELAQQKHIDYLDIHNFVVQNLLYTQTNPFAAKITQIYWEHLPTEERYKLYHHHFLDKYPPLLTVKDSLLVFDEQLLFIFKHKTQMLKNNSIADFDAYLRTKLLMNFYEASKLANGVKIKTIANKKAVFEPYFNQIKQVAPQCLEYVQSIIYVCWVYDQYKQTKDYFYWLDINLSKYETKAHVIDNSARVVFSFPKDKDILNLGLKWVNLAAKAGVCYECFLTKAKILFLLGQKEEAHKLYDEGIKTLPKSFFTNTTYHSEVAKAIGK